MEIILINNFFPVYALIREYNKFIPDIKASYDYDRWYYVKFAGKNERVCLHLEESLR